MRLGDPRRRLRGGFAIVVALLLVLSGRLVQLQGLESTAYASRAENQRSRTVAIRAERGRILDRNLVPLAMDVEARTVFADPSLVKDAEATAAALAGPLHRPAAQLLANLTTKGRFVYLARQVEPDVARTVSQLRLPGVGLLPETRRVYPNGALAASVVGYVNRDGRGGAAIESTLDKKLAGKPGKLHVEEDLSGREIPSGDRRMTAATPGQSQVLTLDRDIQWAAEKAVAAQVAAAHATGGTVIVLNVRTGEILALATVPTFDPNDIAKASRGLLGGNPAISSVYEPGSVNKVITAAAALETGLLNPSSPIVVGPSVKVADKTFTDVHFNGTQTMSFTGVLAKSSNVGTVTVAQQLGRDRLYEFLRRFGLGERTGIRFPAESAGLLPPPKKWSGSQAGTIPIGQGVSATALQIASVYATVANGGVRVTPSLVKGYLDERGRLVPAPAAKRTTAISAATARSLSLMLEAVTNEGGTATLAAIPGYRVAGKTGTARRILPDGSGYSGYVSSFVGYAPADRPELVVEVVIDNPGSNIYGGLVATPVFKQVMSFALATLKVPPTGVPAPPAIPLVLK